MTRATLRLWTAGGLLALVLALAGCAGSSFSGLHRADPQPAAAQVPGVGQPPASPGAALPNFTDLPRPAHASSNLGPGWLPLEQGAVVASSGLTLGAGTAISLSGTPAFAYAIYSIYGFDGDNGPTSARVMSPGSSGDYYVAFSDYQDGKWLWSGPYKFGAAGGSTAITIPNSGQFVSPLAFIGNYFNATYVAIAVKQGAALHNATVELGVHGGRLGPRPAGGIGGQGNATGTTVQWTASPDELAPDFAGYYVERAEAWVGDYAPLNVSPVRECWIADPGAVVGHTYRYRVAAVDVSGNRSVWSEGLGLVDSTFHQSLIPVVHGLPQGPVYGPVTLDLKMDDSYDPEGSPIDTYLINDWNDTLYSSPAFAVMLTLQPGCHKLLFEVKSGTKEGQVVKYIKVLPKWQDSAYMIIGPQSQAAFPRIEGLSMKRTPDGILHTIGYDRFIPGFIDRQTIIGKSSKLQTAPVYYNPLQYCEPQVVGNQVLFGYAYDRGWQIYSSDATGVRPLQGSFFSSTQANPQLAVVSDGSSRVWLVIAQDNGVFRLNIQSLILATPAHLVDPLPSLLDLDATFDPVANAIWVIYSTNTSTEWIKVDPDTLAVMDNGTLAAFASPKVDIEYDAVNHIPVAAYYSLGYIYYTYNDGIWHLGEQVDPSGGNGMAFDLDCSGGKPHIAMGEIGGQTSVYTRTGPNAWNHVDVSYSTASGVQLGLAAFEKSGTNFSVADVGTNRHVYCDLIKPGGTQQQYFDQWPTTGQGLQMHGVGGADGLHVIWDQILGPPQHVIGSADGKTWAGAAMPAGSQLDLSALADGTVYASWNDGANATLQRWDAPAWTQIASQTSTSAVRPFLAHGAPSTVVTWLAYDDAANHLHVWKGNLADGYATADALFDGLYAYSGIGIVDSAAAVPELSTDWYILHCNSVFGYEGSSLGLFDPIDDQNNSLIFHSLKPDALHDQYVFGRNTAAAEYYIATNSVSYKAIWLSNGVEAPAWRYTPNFPRASEYTDLPTNTAAPGFDTRRTVTAATTPHDHTAVALVCDLSGHDQYLEWSNYGDWERLPLPPLNASYDSTRHMNQPELFIGMDGRWHLVYRDYDTDTIYCRSTL